MTDFRRVWDDIEIVVCWIVDWESEFIDQCFIEAKICYKVRVGRPPNGVIARKDFFLIYPVGDAVEERSVA